MEAIAIIQLVVTALVAFGVAILGYRQIQATHDLSEKVRKLTTQTDQTIQRLYRIREAMITSQKAVTLNMTYHETLQAMERDSDFFREKSNQIAILEADISTANSELAGLIIAIGDARLLALYNRIPHTQKVDWKASNAAIKYSYELTGVVAEIHARISELLIEATK